MKELIKPLTNSTSLTDEGNDSNGGSTGVLGEFASEALAKALSNQGGFGIADKIVHSLTPSGNTKMDHSVMGDLHTNTVTQGLK
jgi:Rod binding domain-containing protein